tara:strand:- start:299 stop:634 length:336 start_codon:yes stop_codon:yes gene_type:complete
MSSIDWNSALKPAPSVNMALAETTLNEEHIVNFESLSQTPQGYIVADVSSETLEGDTLWLRGKYGSQNGFGSLMAAVENEGEMIEGNSFIFTKVESSKSPKGYAYRWQKVE